MRTDEGGAFELAGGCAAVVGTAFVAVALFGPAEQVDRAVVVAIAVGVLAAVLRDWRASLGVTVLGALVFVGFLAHRAGQLTGDPAAWQYALIIGAAGLIGRGRSLAVPILRPLPRRADRILAHTRPTSARF